MGRLDGKVAIVTGGARGQGGAEATVFCAEGAEVVVTDVLRDEGERLAAEIGATFLPHDVRSEEEWAEVSSVAGLRGAPGGFAYGASKSAVTGMTKSASHELARHGVRVNSIHPGMIETEMMDAVTNGNATATTASPPRCR